MTENELTRTFATCKQPGGALSAWRVGMWCGQERTHLTETR
jgi:hypothetical protein